MAGRYSTGGANDLWYFTVPAVTSVTSPHLLMHAARQIRYSVLPCVVICGFVTIISHRISYRFTFIQIESSGSWTESSNDSTEILIKSRFGLPNSAIRTNPSAYIITAYDLPGTPIPQQDIALQQYILPLYTARSDDFDPIPVS